jgi:F-type H+-transporting ATPase subunit gamma
MKREGVVVRKHHDVWDGLDFAKAQAIAHELTEAYVSGEIDGVRLIYNEFINVGTQRVVVDTILPIQPGTMPAGGSSVDYEYEPSRDVLLDALLPREIAVRIYRALLESAAAEHAARMQAMENASKNAKEMVATLTLFYNRARQAAITTELMEIIGGAEALKG